MCELRSTESSSCADEATELSRGFEYNWPTTVPLFWYISDTLQAPLSPTRTLACTWYFLVTFSSHFIVSHNRTPFATCRPSVRTMSFTHHVTSRHFNAAFTGLLPHRRPLTVRRHTRHWVFPTLTPHVPIEIVFFRLSATLFLCATPRHITRRSPVGFWFPASPVRFVPSDALTTPTAHACPELCSPHHPSTPYSSFWFPQSVSNRSAPFAV